MKLQRNGLNAHIKDGINKTNAVLISLHRFIIRLPVFRNQHHACKDFVNTNTGIPPPPPIPLCSIRKYQQLKLHQTLSNAVRFIYKGDNRQLTLEEMYTEANNITPINIALHTKAQKIWETVKQTDQEIYQHLTQQDNSPPHHWFPRSASIIDTQAPQLFFTETQTRAHTHRHATHSHMSSACACP